MRSAILATRNRCHVHRPPFMTPARPTNTATDARPRRIQPLIDQPLLNVEYSTHRVAMDNAPCLPAEMRLAMSMAEGQVLRNHQPAHRLGPERAATDD
jgi:hypothetical protein